MSVITTPEEIPHFESLYEVNSKLTNHGCHMCELGFQENINGCCVTRGTYNTNKMIVGEAPGKHEDADGEPFTGPAGKLLDKIWESVSMSTNGWYLTNTVLCRPIAPKGSFKENFTPKQAQRDRCRPYLEAQIRLLSPDIIVTVGRPATEAILAVRGIRMGDYRGQMHHLGMPTTGPEMKMTAIFPIIHPAAILHGNGSPQSDQYRLLMWEDVQNLKKYIEENKL
jgi:uracil-DNA glycosylase family 4